MGEAMWDGLFETASDGSEGAERGRSRALALLRAACAPGNLVVAGTLLTGWLALVAWTGVGPESWQARLCAGLDAQPRACGEVRPGKDASRIVPHTAAARSSS